MPDNNDNYIIAFVIIVIIALVFYFKFYRFNLIEGVFYYTSPVPNLQTKDYDKVYIKVFKQNNEIKISFATNPDFNIVIGSQTGVISGNYLEIDKYTKMYNKKLENGQDGYSLTMGSHQVSVYPYIK